MPSRLVEIFEDKELVDKIGRRLPFLFQLAELESSRAGKIGMEVGSLREKIVIALLIYKFGEENVETQIPITEREIDVKLFGHPVSIKTITGMGGVKIIWTVDAQKAREFFKTYTPTCDIILVQIKWNGVGGFFYIPIEVQQRILRNVGREKYLKLPKPGTNPRGVEISKEGLLMLMEDKNTKSIKIVWQRSRIEYDPYRRWVDYWREG
ncbi:type II restriction endonuclease subunit R [Candidatus Bathyarchaeota archaeon]|nr:MAG: type II restriction endonuclease subunit R [Candidatus Bathyarchaeota archaeon]